MRINFTLAILFALSGCFDLNSIGNLEMKSKTPRMSLFIGVDISGSFMRSSHFEDAMDFTANYIYSHLNGFGGLEVPKTLFVGPIGGAQADEAKTFYPIQTFENKSVAEIRSELNTIFPKKKENPFTDFNAYFKQVENTVRNRKMLLRPVSIVLISDGKPDFINTSATTRRPSSNFKAVDLKPVENLARDTTIRLLYTDAVTGNNWQTQVPRRRIKVWTQDAAVMKDWKDPDIMKPNQPYPEQERFFSWMKENVDFSVRSKKVD